MTRSSSRISTAILVSVLGLIAVPASAQGSNQEAVSRYKEGRALIEKKQYDEALRELSASYEMLESPNTLLLMAHAERELGQESKAAEHYEKVIVDAKDRVARGEDRFEKTATDAQEWLDKLSARLGRITITVTGASEGTTVSIDGKPVDAARTSADTVKVDGIWWKAGAVQIEASTADGASRSMNAEIPRGGPATVALDLGDVVRDQPPPAADDSVGFDTKELEGKSIPTASWVTGGIGVAGLATFAIFGSMAKSKSSELDACAPRCPESDRDVADAGKRDQTVANIGLAVGGIGLAAAAGFYLFQSPSEPEAGTVDVGVAPTGFLVRGTFH